MKESAAKEDVRENVNVSAKEHLPFPILRTQWIAALTDAVTDVRNGARRDGKKEEKKEEKSVVRTDGMTDAAGVIPVDVSHNIF